MITSSSPPRYEEIQIQPISNQLQQQQLLTGSKSMPLPLSTVVLQPSGGSPVSERICCMSARTWSIFIAWMQIFGSALAFTATVFLVVMLIIDRNHQKGNDYLVTSVLCPLLLIMCLFGFIMGIILLLGVIKKRPSFLYIWIISACITVILGIASSIIPLVILGASKVPSSSVATIVIQIVVSLFYMGVVHRHRIELLESKKLNETDPTLQNTVSVSGETGSYKLIITE